MPKTSCIRVKTEEFDRFTETGKASDEFLRHFGECNDCQKTAEEIAELQSRTRIELLRYLHLR